MTNGRSTTGPMTIDVDGTVDGDVGTLIGERAATDVEDDIGRGDAQPRS
jgi:hypothetical protein